MSRASAPAKVILLGEHTSLYGNHAIAVAIDKRARVTVEKRDDSKTTLTAPGLGVKQMPVKRHQRGAEMVRRAVDAVGGGYDINIESQIPTASGMGSSAAIASALVMALHTEAKIQSSVGDIANSAWDCENAIHSKSSGLDPFTVTYGGLIIYKKGIAEPLKSSERPIILIAHSGISSDTGDIVRIVDTTRQSNPAGFDSFLKKSEKLALQGRRAIVNSNWRVLGELMTQNHELLRKLGTSLPAIDRLVDMAKDAGALGAKVSGAGRGGVIIALAADENSKKAISKALSRAGAKIIDAKIAEEGVRLE